MVAVMLGRSTLAAEFLPPTIIKQMEDKFLNLGFSKVATEKLVDDQMNGLPMEPSHSL